MATLKELNIKLGADISDLERKMKRASNQLRREGRNWSSLGNELSAAVSLPLLGIGAAAIKSAADFEKMETSFSVLLGSAEKAKDLFSDLKEFSAATPFQLGDIADSARQLLAFGFSVEQSKDALQFLGDIAGGTNSNLSELTMILGQAKAIGAAYTQDLRQLANRGIPVFDLLKEKFQVSGEELGKMVTDGKISFEVLQDVLKDTTKEGGLFFGGMEKQSKTLAGQFSTFKDNVANSLASLGASISDALDLKEKMAAASKWIAGVAEAFDALDDSTKKNIVNIGLTVAAIGPALKAYGLMKNTAAGVIDLHRAALPVFKSFASNVLAAAESFRKMDMIMKATTVGLVAAGIAALVFAVHNLNSELSTAEKIQRNLNDVNTNAAKSIAAEKVEAERLTAVLQDENATREEKVSALQKLKGINSEYFGQLDLEKDKVEGVNTALEAYISNIERRAKMAAANEKLVEIEKALLDTQQQIDDAGPSYLQQGINAVLNYGNAGKIAAANLSDFNANLSDNRKALEEQKAALLALINETEAPMAGTSTGNKPTASKPTGGDSTAKKDADAMTELAAAYDLIAKKAQIYGTELDANAARSNAIQEAINTLLKEGLTPQDEQVAMLAERYRNLNLAALETAEIQAVNIEPVLAVNTALAAQADQVRETAAIWEGFGNTIAAAADAAGSSMITLASAGEASYKKLGKAALKSAADAVRSALMTYVANVIKDTGLISGPLAPLLAPAAGAAAGIGFNAILKGLKVPALAEGAIVDRPTLALIGEKGPEIVAPPQKLPGLATMMGKERQGRSSGGYIAETRIKGSDLIVMLREAALSEQRRTGSSFLLNNR